MTAAPRPEHPRPQFRRDRWLNLNGPWGFEVDQADTGLERGLLERPLAGSILVPFAPESIRSGVHATDFLHAVWYRREVTVPAEWAGDRVLLHFGAVDHDATVWIDGREVGRHRGGYASFTVDVTEVAAPGSSAVLVVRARDEPTAPQARGKQASTLLPEGPHYERVTGIWQTVWLEPVPHVALRRPHISPDLGRRTLLVEAPVTRNPPGMRLQVVASADGREVASSDTPADLDLTPRTELRIAEGDARVWSPRDPFLYDLRIRLVDAAGRVIDEVRSYAGLRAVAIDGNRLLLNGEPVFQRLVLDQGWWPETLTTAPSDEAMVEDIRIGLAAGFNGARLHQRAFEERHLFHADRLGWLVWGEYGDWGADTRLGVLDNQRPDAAFVAEWMELVERDRSHPSIVGWCPMNETRQRLGDRIRVLDDVIRGMYAATKAADPTRPVIDASGYTHRVPELDVYDAHDYEQDPVRFAANHAGLREGRPFVNAEEGTGARWSLPYAGQPYLLSEFGGLWWRAGGRPADPDRVWGDPPATEDAFHERFAALVGVLLDDPAVAGYCWTQLTDVFQEENGLVAFDRSRKLDLDRLRAAQDRPAAIELLPRR